MVLLTHRLEDLGLGGDPAEDEILFHQHDVVPEVIDVGQLLDDGKQLGVLQADVDDRLSEESPGEMTIHGKTVIGDYAAYVGTIWELTKVRNFGSERSKIICPSQGSFYGNEFKSRTIFLLNT